MKEPGVNMNMKYVEHSHTVRSIQYLALSIKAKGEQVLCPITSTPKCILNRTSCDGHQSPCTRLIVTVLFLKVPN